MEIVHKLNLLGKQSSMQQLIVLVFVFSVLNTTFAQRDQGGFIAPGDSLSKVLAYERIVFVPKGGFIFYEEPNGKFKGKVLQGAPFNSPGSSAPNERDSLMSASIMGAYIRPQLLGLDAFFETSDDRYHLEFDQQKENHVRVLSEGYNGWVSIDQIKSAGFILVSWMEFYGESVGNLIHPRGANANLRMSPYADAAILTEIDELFSEVMTTGQCEGNFCKVDVQQFANPYDQSKSREENTINRMTGWLQIIDEEGKPLVAHNSHGA